jgi:hypothetical protein
MITLESSKKVQGLFEGLACFGICLVLSGCPENQQSTPRTQVQPQLAEERPSHYVAYPSLVYDVPRCYDRDKDGVCHRENSHLYLDFDYLDTSKSILWEDMKRVRKKSNYWRLRVFKASDGTLQGSIPWTSTTSVTVDMELPLEVLLNADFEFCSRNSTQDCDEDTSEDKILQRGIPFLMHTFPEPPMKQKKKA